MFYIGSSHRRMSFLSIFAWGVPAAIVISCLIVDNMSYFREQLNMEIEYGPISSNAYYAVCLLFCNSIPFALIECFVCTY